VSKGTSSFVHVFVGCPLRTSYTSFVVMEGPREATMTAEPPISMRDQVLPSGWDVHTPSSGAKGISKFPVAHVRRSRHVKELSYLANYLCGIAVSDAED
jgi:hypothetical protein